MGYFNELFNIEEEGSFCWLNGHFSNGTLFSREGIVLGREVFIYPGVVIITKPVSRNIVIGDRTCINANSYVGGEKISIGCDVLIGAGCSISSGKHRTERTDITMREQEDQFRPIIIEDDVWIGTNATVLSGVTIGKGSIIGAGSLVNKDVLPYSVVVGVPAKLLRMRK